MTTLNKISKCKICTKIVKNGQNSISCDGCNNWFHQKCSRISNKEFKIFCTNKNKKYFCDFCQNFPCGNCKHPVFNNQNALSCDCCQNWYHLKCTSISLHTYNSYKTAPDTWWVCKNCHVFPFSDVSNQNLVNLFYGKPTFADYTEALTSSSTIQKYNSTCSVCNRKITNKKIHKALPCHSCMCFIHRKCSGITLSDLNNLPKEVFTNWRCPYCYKETFPFQNENVSDLLKLTFNSNFDCPCQYVTFDNNVNIGFDDRFGPDPDNMINKSVNLNVNFDYYSAHSFHKLSKHLNDRTFSVFHSNIESLMHNFDHLNYLLNNLNYKFDIIALSETWNSTQKVQNFRPGIIEGYHQYLGQQGTTIKGGCGFYIRNIHKYIERKKLDLSFCDDNNEFQTKWIEIINEKNVNILIGVFYRHPRKSSDNIFCENLKQKLSIIKKENKNIILVGDFNYCLLKYSSDKHVRLFVDTLYENFVQPCILEPTRIVKGQRPSIVDNIFTNIIDKEIISGNFLEKISDHLPNFTIIKDLSKKRQRQKISKRDFTKFNENDYIYDVSQITIGKVSDCNTNELYNKFHTQLESIINKHAPIKTYSNREVRWVQKPWYTKGLQKSIHIKEKLYKKFVLKKDPFWFNKYKFYRSQIRKLTKISKHNYYRKYFTKNLRNSKKTWSGINELLHKRKTKENSIFLNVDGSIVTDQKVVANKFNDYYGHIADELVEKLPKPNTKFQDYLKNPNEHSMFLKETEPAEVYQLLTKLDVNKSDDIYRISAKLLLPIAHIICFPLSSLINKSFECGEFPSMLKLAKVIPLFKSGSKMETSNYRPISLLPIISKIFEKIMYTRLRSYLDKEKIFYDRQYGFQKGKSTENAILDLQAQIITSLENGEIPCTIFLDFSKAFDTVNHNVLLKKLEHYGVRGNVLQWFSSYILDRKQRVQLNDNLSDCINITNGVPQGSILGPLLFLIYINDITNASNILKFFLFADDTSIFFSHKDKKILESLVNVELNKLSDWLSANKLSLNMDKSNVLLFRPKNASQNLSSRGGSVLKSETYMHTKVLFTKYGIPPPPPEKLVF